MQVRQPVHPHRILQAGGDLVLDQLQHVGLEIGRMRGDQVEQGRVAVVVGELDGEPDLDLVDRVAVEGDQILDGHVQMAHRRIDHDDADRSPRRNQAGAQQLTGKLQLGWLVGGQHHRDRVRPNEDHPLQQLGLTGQPVAQRIVGRAAGLALAGPACRLRSGRRRSRPAPARAEVAKSQGPQGAGHPLPLPRVSDSWSCIPTLLAAGAGARCARAPNFRPCSPQRLELAALAPPIFAPRPVGCSPGPGCHCPRPLACWRMWRSDHRSGESFWSADRRRCWPTGPSRGCALRSAPRRPRSSRRRSRRRDWTRPS